MGDAQKLTQTYSGQVAMLAFNFNNLKVALGNSLIPVLRAILPHINNAINALTVFANKLSSLTQAIFGKAIVENSAAATSGVDGLTESITESGDAAKKAAKNLATTI